VEVSTFKKLRSLERIDCPLSIELRASFKYIIKTVDYKERGDNNVIYKKHGGTPDQ
jgi:hypothetical protein